MEQYSPGYNNGSDETDHDDETIHEGFKSAFIHHNHDAIALGCSFTSTQILPAGYIWPDIIKHLTQQNIAVISATGVGLNWLWNNYIRFVTEYGNPTQVYLLTPDLRRIRFKSNRNLNPNNDHQLNWQHKSNDYTDWGGKKARITAHNGKTIPINTALATHTNLTSLDNLHHHTQQNNIQFTHTTWWKPTHNTLTKLAYPKYTPLNTKCDHTPQTTHQQQWWNNSHDNQHGGLHDQIHFAQTLINTHITNTQIATLPTESTTP